MDTKIEEVDSKEDVFEFSKGQQEAIDGLVDWTGDDEHEDRVMTLGGDAGTGKTTVIRELVNRLGYVSVAAFTGKAASVLRNKGVHATTIHSLIYRYDSYREEFVLRGSIEPEPNLIIIDEGSMVNMDLFRDLVSFGYKLLFVGDPKQLEPIGDNPNLMKELDFTLDEIHRQAAESPIIQFSQVAAQGLPFQTGSIGDELNICPAAKFTPEAVLEHDHTICGFNKTRTNMNTAVRHLLNRTKTVELGEKMICLQNNHNQGVFNGMMATVIAILDETATYIKAEVEDEIGTRIVVKMLKAQIGAPQKVNARQKNYGELTLWDYGYVTTCHKSQGSEWDKVLVYEELWDVWDPRRWRYTAITRAANQLTYCVP